MTFSEIQQEHTPQDWHMPGRQTGQASYRGGVDDGLASVGARHQNGGLVLRALLDRILKRRDTVRTHRYTTPLAWACSRTRHQPSHLNSQPSQSSNQPSQSANQPSQSAIQSADRSCGVEGKVGLDTPVIGDGVDLAVHHHRVLNDARLIQIPVGVVLRGRTRGSGIRNYIDPSTPAPRFLNIANQNKSKKKRY